VNEQSIKRSQRAGDNSLSEITGAASVLRVHDHRAWYALNGKIDTNSNDIRQIEKSLVEYDQMMEDRVSRLEGYKEQELEAVNKSLLSKVLGGND